MALSGSLNSSSWVADNGKTRYYTVSWTATQNIANNTSTISWTLKSAGTYSYWVAERTLKVTIAGTVVYSKTARVEREPNTTIATGSLTLTHDSTGNKSFDITIQAAVYASAINSTGSQTFTLNTIARKSTLSVGNGTLNTAQTLTVTRQATSLTHTITATCGSASTTICTKSSSTSISFTPPIAWASQNTTGTTVTVKYTITTYSGSTSIGSNSYSKTCSIPSSVKPSVTFTVAEASDLQWGVYIQSVSKLKIVLTATTSYGSAIASYKTTVDGGTYTASSFTTGVLNNSGTLTIKTTVTDKRGRTGTYSQTINVQAYSKPVFTYVGMQRCNEDGTENIQGEYGKVSFDCTCSKLLDKNGTSNNEVGFVIEWKKTDESDYSNETKVGYGIVEGSTGTLYTIFQANSSYSYHVRITANDAFSSTTYVAVLSTGFSIMHWLANGLGMALGKLAELTGVLDIGFQTRFMGGILHPVLEPETDLNDVRTPNTYVGANVSTYNYGHCPMTSGTFTLEVVGCGEDGQVKQKLIYCHKTISRVWERFYYGETWGDWICVSDYSGTLLWDGSVATTSNGYYMSANQIASLSEAVSKQNNGIVLVFSEYIDGSGADQSFHTRFIPKKIVANHPGKGHVIQLSSSNLAYFGTKYVYVSDTQITGHDNNTLTGTGTCGITYTNNRFVLRYVIGV